MGSLDRLLDRLLRLPERREFVRRLARLRTSIRALPLDAARTDAERLLADALRYRVVSGAEAAPHLPNAIGPGLREFFARYSAVEERYGDARFARALIAPSELRPGAWRVGADAEFAEVVALPGADEVLYVPGENPDGDPPEPWPSIYHYLLMNAAVREDYEPPPRPDLGASPSRPAS